MSFFFSHQRFTLTIKIKWSLELIEKYKRLFSIVATLPRWALVGHFEALSSLFCFGNIYFSLCFLLLKLSVSSLVAWRHCQQLGAQQTVSMHRCILFVHSAAKHQAWTDITDLRMRTDVFVKNSPLQYEGIKREGMRGRKSATQTSRLK